MMFLGEINSCRKLTTILSLYSLLIFILLRTAPRMQATLSKYADGLPSVRIDYLPNAPPPSPYNASKLALMIESEAIGHTTPLLLHMMNVVPPDWSFLFLGSNESIALLNQSTAVRRQISRGKLELRWFWPNTTQITTEMVSQLFTNREFYEGELPEAEHLLYFTSNSILCANSRVSLNEWLDYDWVGAPWSPDDKFAGTTGLSLRSISKVKQVLSFQKRLHGADEPEDMWFSNRLGLVPGAKVATAKQGAKFSVQHVWAEKPMGYYLGARGESLPGEVWNAEDKRWLIYNYCPEIKIIADMDVEREHCRVEGAKHR